MVETKSSLQKRTPSPRREKYLAHKRRDWKSVWIRTAVYDMIQVDKRDEETDGEVIARWGRGRANYGTVHGSVDSVFITPDQTKRSQ